MIRGVPMLPLLVFAAPLPLSAQEGLSEWEIDRAPLLEVGVVDGGESEMFVSVHDATLLPGGGLAILDAGAVELRFFDGHGDPMTVAGREGEGPGEFRHPFGVEVVRDSVLVWDWDRATLLSWSTSGEFLTERRVNHHRTIHEGALLPDGSLIIPKYGSDEPPGSGRYRPAATLLRYVGDEVQDLGSFPYHEMMAGQTRGLPSPFASRSAAAAGGDSLRIYVADDTNVPRVRRYDSAGELLETIELLDVREEITDTRWNAIVDSLAGLVGDGAAVRRSLAEWGKPDLGPAFEELVVDAAGRLWVLSRSTSGDRTAIVYDDGSPVGRVDLPGVERIFEIDGDRLLALELGPFDVQIVRLYGYDPS